MREEMFIDVQRWRRNVVVILSLFFTGSVYGVTFEVSNSDELQAALTTAASNGGDDEILLAEGTYAGNFKYTAAESAALVMRSLEPELQKVVLDGEYRAYVLKIVPGCFKVDLTIDGLKVTKGKSDEAGGGIVFVSEGGAFTSLSQCDLAEQEKGSLTLKNVSIEGNYAQDGAGLKANGLGEAKISNTTFLNNGHYINPSLAENNPGGAGSGHIGLQAEKLTFVSNVIGAIASPFDGSRPTLGNNFFTSAVDLQSFSNSTIAECSISLIEGNSFKGISTLLMESASAAVPGAAEPSTVIEEVIPFRDVVNINGGECAQIRGNTFAALKGASINLGAKVVNDNRFDGLRLTQKIAITTDELVGNVFSQVLRGVGGWASALGTRQGTIVGLNVLGLSATTTNAALIGVVNNRFDDLGGAVDVMGSTRVVSNVFSKIQDSCALRVAGNQIQVRNNTVARVGSSGICVVINSYPNASVEVINNIVWPATSESLGIDIERIGYGSQTTLTNNIFQNASELWDVEEGNLVVDPAFFDVENGDLHVRAGSVAVNGGFSDGFFDAASVDLDGNLRVLDGAVDIGAYERATTALHPADTNGDSSISSAEFEAYNSAWRANEAWTTSPVLIPVDFVTRAGYLLQKGGSYKNIGVGKPATWTPVNE